jgi:gliding motility-associated-like protein
MKRKLLIFSLLVFVFFNKGLCQTIINVNLSGKADTSVIISSNRSGNYCGDNNCVVFVVTLNPGSDFLNINGSQISASDNYTVNCGPQTPVGTPVCVSGLTTANIAFCKPGNNTISYTITASSAVHASGDITLRQGCTSTLSVTGLSAATVTWTSIYPGAAGAYNSYLSCSAGCASTNVTPTTGAPAYIDYKVSGTVTSCPNTRADTVRVYTVPAMTIALTPANPVICSGGSSNIILTATPSGGNPPYTYLWNTGATTQSITASSAATYSVSVSDNTTGCASVPQSVTVTTAPTPAAPTAAGTTICSGSSGTITATAPGGTYQWYNAASGGTLLITNASYTTPALTSTTTYYVQTTVGGCISPRTAVTVTVNPIPAAPIAASTSTCSGSSATLTATAPGGTYGWYDAASGGTLLSTGPSYITPSLTVNTTYYVQTTVNGCSSPRTAVTVTIIPTPISPTAAGTSTCSGTAVTLTATAPGGNYDWYDSASGGTSLLSGATFTTPVLTSTTTYYVQTTVNGCVSPRTPVIVTINAIPAAPTVAGATICNGTSATLTATAPGGTYQWYDAPSGGTLLTSGTTYTTAALTTSTTYYVQTIVNGCVSARSAVIVTVNPVTAAPTASGTTICAGSTATLTATAPGGTYDWFSAPSGGSLLFTGASYTTPVLITSTTYYVQATVNGCAGARTAVIVTVNPTPAAPTASGTSICEGNTATLTATAPGGTYEWYDAASGGTLLFTGSSYTTSALTTSATYYVQTTVNGCVSARTTVSVTVNPLPVAPTASGSTICQGSTATLTASAPGGTYNWYSVASGGSPLFTGATYTTPALSTTTTYYVDATSASGCTGPRAAVTATVTPPVNPAFFYSSGTFCKTGTNPTPTVMATSGGTFSSTAGLVFVDNQTGELDLAASTIGTYTITFITNTTCAYNSSSSITITSAPDATFSYSGPYCQDQANPLPVFLPGSSSGIFSCPDPALIFANTSTGEIDLQNSTPGTYTVTNNIAAAGGCAAATATNTITISPVATVNAGANQIVCSGQTVTLTGSIGGGATSATWSGGTGSFLDPASLVTTYTLGPGETSVTLTLTTDDPTGPCGAVSDQMTITVNPTPTVTSAANAITCNNTAQSYTITGSVSGTTYSWSRAAVAGISNTAVSGQTSNTITESLVNTTSAPIDVIYSILPTANSCTGPTFTYTITVNPTPTVTSAASAITCNNTAQSYTITGSVSGTTYSWSRAAVAGISNTAVSGQTSNTITESLVNTTAAPIDVIYSIVPTANSCTGPAFTYTVTVNPTPTVTSAANAITCNNTAQSYTITGSVSGTTYSWSRAVVAGISNSAVSGQTSNTITESLINTTSAPVNVLYTIIPSANGCTGPAFTYTITVNPTPTVTSAASAITCNNTAQSYTITGSVSGTTYSWSRAAVAGISNSAVSGQTSNIINEVLTNTTAAPIDVIYSIVPTANSCTGPAFTYTITVNPTPTVTSAASATTCNNTGQGYAITGSVSGTTYSWSRAAVAGISNGAVSGQTTNTIIESLVNTTSAPIDVIYSIVPTANSCTGPTFTYTITVNPTPTVTSAASAITCNNTAQNYTITGSVSGTTYSWSRAAVAGISNTTVSGQISNTITESLVNTTSAPIDVIYSIVSTANSCTGPTFTYTITVNPTPTITSAATATACNNTTQNYTITSNVSGTTFTWNRAATAGISNAPVSGQTTNTIVETLVNTTVNPIDVIYNITPQANGCTGPTFTYTVTVNPTPKVTSSSNALICNTSAQNYTITSDVSGATFTWSRAAIAGISDAAVSGQTSNTITESLTNTGSTPITVTYVIVPVANGCSGPAFNYNLTVNPTPMVTSVSTAVTCNNTAQNYTITSNVVGSTFTWSRVAVAGISNAAVSGQTTSVITETLINTTSAPIDVIYDTIIPNANGCTGPVFTYTVTVNPTPTVTSAASAATCNNTAQSYNITGSVSGTTYSWSRAAVAGISNTAVSGQTSNTITESLINTTSAPVNVLYTIIPSANGCTGPAFTYTITVNPTPTVTSAASATTCNNTAQGYAITGSVNGTTYSWSRVAVAGISNTAVSGQTTNTITESLINTTSAPVNVLYTIIPSANGCTGPTFTYTVTVNPTPTVTSTASATTCNNTAQSYTITGSVSGTTYSWSRAAVAGIGNSAVSGQTSNTITENLVNTTSAPIDVIYSIVPTANSCTGPAFTYTITVNPTPTVTSAANAITCNNTAQNYTITGSVSGTTFSWSRAAVAGISNTAVSGQTSNTITESLINTTSAPVNVIYSIVPSANGCTGPTFTYTVTVNPTPTVTSAASATTCNNTAQGYAITGSVSGTTYSWSRATITGISNTAVSGQTTNTITESLINTTSAPVNVLYTIIPSANGCTGPTFTYTITVNPTPTVTSAASAITCNNTAQSYTITSNVSGTTYSWSRAAVAGISNGAVSGQTTNTITESLINTTAAPIDVIYSIVPTANSCTGPAFTYTITVNPTPTVTSAANAITCNNTAQNYTITGSVSGTTYSWSRAAVAGISNSAVSGQTSNIINEVLTNTTAAPIDVIYSIVPTANSCTGPAFTYTVTVNPTPTVTSAANAITCNNTAQSYTITGSVSGTTYSWSRAVVAGISNSAVSGQTSNTITESLINTTSAPVNVLYTIIPSANGCTGPAFTYTITVNPTPTVTSAASAITCNNTAQSYTITGSVSGTTYSWSRAAVAGIGNSAVSGQTSNTITESLVNTTAAPIDVIYSIVPTANSCTGPAFTYTITVNPTPTVTSAANAITCNNTAQNYTITGSVSGTTFSWSRAAVAGISNTAVSGQTSNTITESLINTTSAPVNVIYSIVPSANGCTGPTFTYTVTVNPTPTVTSAASATTCNNTAQGYAITGSVSGTTYSWNRAAVAGISNSAVSGQTSNTITESLVNTTSAPIDVIYSIVPTANSCTGPTLTYTITVNPTPTVTSAASAITCNNTAQNYNITGSVSGTTYSWSRAAVAGISNTGVSGQTSNTIAETLINTTAAPVNVLYTILPTANGCMGSAFTYTVTVNPTPIVTNSSLSQIVCSQGTSSVVSFTSNVAGVTFNWTATATSTISGFAASGTGNIPARILLNSDVAKGTITYVVTPYYNGCPGTASNYIITVNPKPVTPVAGSNSPVCQNYPLILTTPTIAGASYTWIGPNGFTSNAQNPTISNASLAAAGLYSLQVTVDGCTSDVGNVNVIILPTPAAPVATSNSPLCAGNTLILNANNIAGATYNWTGPNGFTSSAQKPALTNVAATSGGIYFVTATVNGCTSIAGTTNVVVNAIPAAPTATSNSPVCENSTINLSVTGNPGTTYTWTGPNNFFSNLPNPSIPAASQANAGIYTVTATVGNCTGAPTSVTVAVDATPINPVASSNSPVCTGYPIMLTASTFIGAVYKWTGPNGFSSTLQNPIINSALPANAGVYTVSITAPGCLVTASTTTAVDIHQTPIAPTAGSNSPICVGDNLKLSASGIAGATYYWTGPNGFTSTLQNPVINNTSASTAGIYNVTVTLNSCTSAATATQVILSKPKLAIAGNDQVVCANNAKVTLAGNIIGDTNSGVWTSSGTGTFLPDNISLSGLYLPSVADIATGGVTLTLTTTNNGGCSISSSSFKVTINPTPIVNAGGNRSMCTSDALANIPGKITYATNGKWTTSGTGTFVPSDADIDVNYAPSAADKAQGSVKLTLTSTGNNCRPISDTMTLKIIPSPTINMPDFKYILQDGIAVLDPVVTGTNLQYLWNPNLYLSSATVQSPTIKGVESQLYDLSVTGLGGCITQKQIMIYVLKPIIIPNTFTPNGDGINDVWTIKELSNYPGAQVTIFNRYGIRLYYSRGYTKPWDGTYNGKPVPFGTYYYIVNRGIYGPPLSGFVVVVR